MLASDSHISNESECELEERRYERRNSEIMIKVIEERHVRILNRKSEIERGRVPVSRRRSQRYKRDLKLSKSNLLVDTHLNLSSSQPSLVHLDLKRHNSEGAKRFEYNDGEDTNSIISHELEQTSEVNDESLVIEICVLIAV